MHTFDTKKEIEARAKMFEDPKAKYEETMSAIYQHGTKILLRNWIDHERMMQKLYADKRMAESQLTIIE